MITDVGSRVATRIIQASDRITDLTRRLITIQTENPPGRRYHECIELLDTELKALGLPCEVIEVPGNGDCTRYVLLSGVGTGPTVYLHGHYDVVAVKRKIIHSL